MATQVNTTQSKALTLTTLSSGVNAQTTVNVVRALTKEGANLLNTRTTQSKLMVLEQSTSTNPRVYTTQNHLLVLEQSTSANPRVYTTENVIRVLERVPPVTNLTTQTVVRVLEKTPQIQANTTLTDVLVLTTQDSRVVANTTDVVIRVLERNSGSSTPQGIQEVVDYTDNTTTAFRNGRATFLTSRRTYASKGQAFVTKTKDQFDTAYADRYEDIQYYGAAA